MKNDVNAIRTAAYTRVSSRSDLQDGSFEVQCAYFRQKIAETPGMTLVDIYGDQGKSGRTMEGRRELGRLIRDCEAGRIDLILCKSISRFARSMLECVETVRHLTALGVTVSFEREGLRTDHGGSELLLGILAAIAQEESNSISLNMQWSRQKHLELGQPWEPARYGYVSLSKEHRWEIVASEARAVRRAFYMAGTCHSYTEISAELTGMEREAGTHRVWNNTPVRNLLQSVVYIGDYLSNKEVRIVDGNGHVKRVKNKGYANQLYIEGHHEAIIGKELFDTVQEMIRHGLLHSRRVNYSAEDRAVMDRGREAAAREAIAWEIQA